MTLSHWHRSAFKSFPIRCQPTLKQCCAAYKNGLCSIYPNRPNACRTFRCALLKRFEANEISEAEALKIIREALTLRDDLRGEIRAAFGDTDCTLDEFTRRLKAKRQDAASVEAKDRISELFRKFAVLWVCVNKHFRDQWQR